MSIRRTGAVAHPVVRPSASREFALGNQRFAPAARAPTPETWRIAIDSMAAQVAILDRDGLILDVNDAWTRFATLNGGDAARVGPGADYFAACAHAAETDSAAYEVLRGLREVVDGRRDLFMSEYRCDSPTQRRWFAMRATRYRGPGNARVVVTHADITHRRRAEERDRAQAALLDAVDAAVVAVDADGCVTEWNPGAERLYGWSRAEMLGQPIRGRLFTEAHSADAEQHWEALRRAGRWHGDFEARRRDGSTVNVSSRTVEVFDPDGQREGYVSVAADVSERLIAEHRLRDAADYANAITESLADGLVAVDSDGRVTYANDAALRMLGWERNGLIGEMLHELTHYRHADGTPHAIGDCPITIACASDTISRVDDDVFLRYDGGEIPVAYTASPFHTRDGVAGAVVVFRDISAEKARQRRLRAVAHDFHWADRVRAALARTGPEHRFELHAQPIVHIETRELHSEELLLRMRRERELVMPIKFLPAALTHGLMPQVDRWVLAESIRLARGGRVLGVNLSPDAFTDFALLGEIEERLATSRLEPSQLMFEVTETSVIGDREAACRFLTRLRDLGCKIALDDFGTGYSGFTYLKSLPIDYLKIDREFVGDLTGNAASRHVVQAIVSLASMFGQRTIAEGVEDEETLDALRAIGVDFAQGYHLGRPSPAERANEIWELALT